MPSVNWDAFSTLPGSAETNFEMLCRGIVRRHYARYGEFRALASQPGVEFHLRLLSKCQLGDAGRWYGWQCRWYDLPGGRPLGNTRRAKIAKALSVTERVLPKLTDWVLWTRRPLTEGDQDWFFSQKTHMQLHLWTSADIEEHLSGDAEILRGTYFGELVLTPDTLAQLHEVSVAPIRVRWNPAVHQTIDAERELRRMLAEPGTWQDLRAMSQQLATEAKAVRADARDLPEPVRSMAAEIATAAEELTIALTEGHAALEQGDLDVLRERTASPSLDQLKALAPVPRRLRAYRHRAALTVTNALADTRRAYLLGEEVDLYPNMRLVAVTAEAGCGKTELAAQLTAPTEDRPAGVLLNGRNLSANQTLDDLARNVVIQGVPVPSMEALIAAVDAGGQRAHRRLPVVIDGLNEAEDARNWKPLLAALGKILSRYPYVLVICTLRTAFAEEALPSNTPKVDIPDFQQDAGSAISKYFGYYRIDPIDAEFPWWLLRHPLTLRLFCEVTNPKRERVVGVEAMPGSLTELFDRYLEQASERIAELSPRDWRYYRQDVRAALDQIGWELWEEKSRALDFGSLRNNLGDNGRPWHGSIVRLLEQEGVLLRSRRHGLASDEVMVAYDALAGHMVADAVLTRLGRSGFVQWMHEPATVASLTGPFPDRHPLAPDITRALVGLMPRRLHRQQLWPLLDEPLRSVALLGSADLEAAYLDSETIRELASLATQSPADSQQLFGRLLHTRSSPEHPLNSGFLDSMLRPMSVTQRDLHWTEWVRSRSKEVVEDLEYIEKRWHTLAPRSHSDKLRGQWVLWTLTSTAKKIRDQATRTLYWFGRGDAAALFTLALESLSINDPSVSERALAASYGVVMAHQMPDALFEKDLAQFISGLLGSLGTSQGTNATNNWLLRLYVEGCVELACVYYKGAVAAEQFNGGKFPFASGPAVDRIETGDSRAAEVDGALSGHYNDDTLSEFIGFRRGAWTAKQEHHVVGHLRGTLWAFGWRNDGMGAIDKNLPREDYHGDRGSVQRYGDKYAWIGLYTYPEMAEHYNRIWDGARPPDVQIDPSFPDPAPRAPFTVPSLGTTDAG
jgi:hypothetical protein